MRSRPSVFPDPGRLKAAPILLSIAAALTLYASTVVGIARQWFDDSNTAYGALLVAAAAFVAWRARHALAAIAPRPGNWGFALLTIGLTIYVVGTITGDVFLLRISLPVVLCAAIVALWGFAHVRLLMAPLALLFLAVPLPAVLLTRMTMPLQLMASSLAAGVLSLAHVPVVRDGNLLTLPNITLEVAEACNGMRSVVSLVSVAAVCGAVLPLSRRRAALLIAAAVPIGIAGNGLRVAGTGLLAQSIGELAVKGTIHELTGFVAFVAMCLATLACLRVTRSSTGPVVARTSQTRMLGWARLHR